MTRRSWIGIQADVTHKRQCVLAGVVRGTLYAQHKPKSPSEGDEVLKRSSQISINQFQSGDLRRI